MATRLQLIALHATEAADNIVEGAFQQSNIAGTGHEKHWELQRHHSDLIRDRTALKELRAIIISVWRAGDIGKDRVEQIDAWIDEVGVWITSIKNGLNGKPRSNPSYTQEKFGSSKKHATQFIREYRDGDTIPNSLDSISEYVARYTDDDGDASIFGEEIHEALYNLGWEEDQRAGIYVKG
ncbi:MAG: hypothetical protein Q8S00_32375 [Deltaproteobacteria bacterium]|nr:hypothetical protein [Deltaproteobacteria bacterium]